MLEYFYCLIFVTVCWIIGLYMIVGSFLKGGPSVFAHKPEIQVWFNCYYVMGLRRGLGSYIEAEFEHMLAACQQTQGSRENFKILEIGVGTGANFPYYPENNSVTVVENNPFFREYYISSAGENNIRLENELSCSAEDMKDVPSGSMDCVVSTYTLCAVGNVDAVLKEVKRVLRPGGCFLFVEPVRDPEDIVNFVFQLWISPITKLYLGIDFTRRLLRNIEATFEDVQAHRCDLQSELYSKLYSDVCFKPHIRGIARK